MKKNKKNRVRDDYIVKIKIDYFNGISIEQIAKKYGYDYHFLRKYLNGRATKIYIDKNGVEWRRCSVCRIYRETLKDYTKSTPDTYKPHCKTCHSRKVKNKYILDRNIGNLDPYRKRARKTWDKNKWRYNTRRKVLKIIKYIDYNGRIIHKK